MGWQAMAVQGLMTVAAAKKSRDAYANDAQASFEQAEMAGIQADQEAINRTAQLREQLASISASGAGGGVSVGAGGSMGNIKRRETRLASMDVSAIKTLGGSKGASYGAGAYDAYNPKKKVV